MNQVLRCQAGPQAVQERLAQTNDAALALISASCHSPVLLVGNPTVKRVGDHPAGIARSVRSWLRNGGRLRFALWNGETGQIFRKGGRKRGRSQARNTGQNEFKKAFTTRDSIRKHMRLLTANPVVAQVARASYVSSSLEDASTPEIRPGMSFDIDQSADWNQLRVA